MTSAMVERRSVRLADLLEMPVRAADASLGRVCDVVLNGAESRVLGIEMCVETGRSHEVRFVPWLGVETKAGHLAITSARGALPPALVRLFSHGSRLSAHPEHVGRVVVDTWGALGCDGVTHLPPLPTPGIPGPDPLPAPDPEPPSEPDPAPGPVIRAVV